jgi:hypothetical protein
LGDGVAANVFTYVKGTPTTFADPSGLLWVSGGTGWGGGGGAHKGTSKGDYFNPGTGDYGSYESTSGGVSGIGGAVMSEYGIGSGDDPGGIAYYGSIGGNLFGLACEVTVSSDGSDWGVEIGFGFEWPPNAPGGEVGREDTTVDSKGNAYEEATDAITAPYRARQFIPWR